MKFKSIAIILFFIILSSVTTLVISGLNDKQPIIDNDKPSLSHASSGEITTSSIENDRYQYSLLQDMAKQLNRINHTIERLEENDKVRSEDLARLQRQINKDDSFLRKSNHIEPQEQTELTIQEISMEFENQFVTENVDSEWAPNAETQFYETFADLSQEITDLEIGTVSCQSTLCKVDYKVHSEASIQSSLDHINHSLDWETKSFAQYDISESGEITINSYFMREGFDYPDAVR